MQRSRTCAQTRPNMVPDTVGSHCRHLLRRQRRHECFLGCHTGAFPLLLRCSVVPAHLEDITSVWTQWRSCVTYRLGFLQAFWQSVREVDAAYHNEGPHQHSVETEPAHRQQCGETSGCGCKALEDSCSYARHWRCACKVRAHALNLKREKVDHNTNESNWTGGCVTSG